MNYLANYKIKIAFKITNPTVTVTNPIMIPLIIYSESLSTRRKTNYNYIENGIYVKDCTLIFFYFFRFIIMNIIIIILNDKILLLLFQN